MWKTILEILGITFACFVFLIFAAMGVLFAIFVMLQKCPNCGKRSKQFRQGIAEGDDKETIKCAHCDCVYYSNL